MKTFFKKHSHKFYKIVFILLLSDYAVGADLTLNKLEHKRRIAKEKWEEVAKLTPEDREIYNSTKRLCGIDSQVEYYEKESELFLSSFAQVNVFTVMSDLIEKQDFDFQMSDKLQSYIGSIGYFKAINECYGSDENKKNIFFTSLLFTDLAGKLMGVVFDITFIRKVFLWIKAMNIIPQSFLASPYLTKLRYVLKIAALSRGPFNGAFATNMMLATLPGAMLAGFQEFNSKMNAEIDSEYEISNEYYEFLIAENDFLSYLRASNANSFNDEQQFTIEKLINLNNEKMNSIQAKINMNFLTKHFNYGT